MQNLILSQYSYYDYKKATKVVNPINVEISMTLQQYNCLYYWSYLILHYLCIEVVIVLLLYSILLNKYIYIRTSKTRQSRPNSVRISEISDFGI